MSKKKLLATAAVTAFFLILLPAPSRAASRNWTLFPEPAASLYAKIERWWNLVLNGPERPARPEPSPVWQKNGCGIDPNGLIVCEPDGGTTQTTQSAGSGVK